MSAVEETKGKGKGARKPRPEGKGEDKGERKPREPKPETKVEGGKGGRGDSNAEKTERPPREPRAEGESKGKGKGDRAPREKRKHEDIPTYDDPQAEIDKMEKAGEPKKPDRAHHEKQVSHKRSEIEAYQKQVDSITKQLDDIKEKNEKAKAASSGPAEQCREVLRELKKGIVIVVEERKRLSAAIEKIREAQNREKDEIEKARMRVGRFSSDELINNEIARIESVMSHSTLTPKEEKQYMIEIKDLNKKREDVKQYEIIQGKRGSGGEKLDLPSLFEARKVVDTKLDALRAQEKDYVERLNAMKENSAGAQTSEKFVKLLEERTKIRDNITLRFNEIRDMHSEFNKLDDVWFDHDRKIKNIKWQLRKKQEKQREIEQKEWQEKKKREQEEWEKKKETDKEAWEAEKAKRDAEAEEARKAGLVDAPMDVELAERIGACDQLATFLSKYVPKEEKEEDKPVVAGGRTVATDPKLVAHSGVRQYEDVGGLNQYMVDEVVSKRAKQKEKKKEKNKSKTDEAFMIASGEVLILTLTLDMMKSFVDMGLDVPVDSSDCPASIAALAEKKKYFQSAADEGLTLKQLQKRGKETKTVKKEAAPEKDAPEKATAEASVDEDRVGLGVAEKYKTTGTAKAEGKMSDGQNTADFDVEKMRAAARARQATPEELKARGMLYDTTKARAVREESESDEDEDSCAIEGGDPFEGL